MSAPLFNSQFIHRLKSASRLFGALTGAIGALALAGWTFNVPALKSVIPGLAEMKANTAVCFIMAGAGLWLLRQEKPGPAVKRSVIGLGVALAAVGLGTLGEFVLGWNLGIDELLFKDTVTTHGAVAYPGRMAPVTAFNFALLGCSFMLFANDRHRMFVPQALILAVGLINCIALSGFVFNVESLYQFSPYSQVALHTVLAFLILCLGLLLARPDRGAMAVVSADDTGGFIARRLIPLALIVPVLLAWLSQLGIRAGLFDANIAASFRVVAHMAVFATVVWWCARLLNQADEVRRKADQALLDRTEELARSNAELEQFAYVSSHDLQEPLRAVAGCVQLLQRRYQDKLDERADELIRHAVDGSQRMQNLINDLLAYSRVGTRGRSFEPVDTSAVLQGVLASLETAFRESGAVVNHNGLPRVEGDPVQLGQLLQNLIANAIKFRGAEPPRITVSACREDGAWEFLVSDNGIGIEPQYFERIFAMFQRLHTTREYPGTGIGLAICKKIVERHGGRIWVVSDPGRGATFHFTIPDRRKPI